MVQLPSKQGTGALAGHFCSVTALHSAGSFTHSPLAQRVLNCSGQLSAGQLISPLRHEPSSHRCFPLQKPTSARCAASTRSPLLRQLLRSYTQSPVTAQKYMPSAHSFICGQSSGVLRHDWSQHRKGASLSHTM